MVDQAKMQAQRELRDLMTELNVMTLSSFKPAQIGMTEIQATNRRSYLISAISVLKSGAGTLQDVQEERLTNAMIEAGEKAPVLTRERKLTAEHRGFAKYLATGEAREYRDAQAGKGVVAQTQGTSGGYFVPQEF